MDDNQNEGSLLDNFLDVPAPDAQAPAATTETGVSVPDLSITMPNEIVPDGVQPEFAATPDAPAPDPVASLETSAPEAPMMDLPTPEAETEAPIAGENAPDPVDSVNQMLGEAVIAEATAVPEASAEITADSSSGFSLVVYGPVAADLWKKVLQNANFKELNFAAEPPKDRIVVSRLTEYKAIATAVALKNLGLMVEPKPPGAALPEPPQVVSEGAPSVTLAKDASEVFLYTGDQPPGYRVQNLDGVVTAHRSIARRFFRDLEAQELLERELQKLHKPSKIRKLFPASAMERLFGGLFLDLQKAALSRGANGVVALRVSAHPESSNLDPDLEQIRLVALGTAAVVEKAEL